MIKLSKKVEFTSMKEGTKDDYDLITIHDSEMKDSFSIELLIGLK